MAFIPTEALVDHVIAHATENYEAGGWDVIVECWDRQQIAEQIRDAETPTQAVAAFAGVIDVYSDRQADARNSAF